MGDDSGTGVVLHPRPVDRRGACSTASSSSTPRARTSSPASARPSRSRAMRERAARGVRRSSLETLERLEAHYRDMQDIEFTVEEGTLYLLQTRTGKRTAAAALRDRGRDGRRGADHARGGGRADRPGQLDQLLHPMIDPTREVEVVAHGPQRLARARPSGAIVLDADTAERARQGRRGRDPRALGDDARRHPRPDPGAGHPHGARRHDVARRRRRARDGQAVRGRLRGARDRRRRAARSTIGEHDVREGDVITIDGGTGARDRRRRRRSCRRRSTRTSSTILGWADELRRLRVRANADTPEDAARAREFGAEGIGLCRTEHMFMAEDRLPVVREMILAATRTERRGALDELLPMQQADFEGIFEAMAGLPGHDPAARPAAARVPARRSRRRPTRTRCAQRIAQLHESNPMLGTRGCRLGLQYPEIYEMQVRAIVRAAPRRRRAHGRGAAGRDHDPARRLRARSCARLRELTERGRRPRSRTVAYLVGTMIELPRAVHPRRRDRRDADFFSLRHQRPDPDDARLLPRRRRGQVPHATTSRTAILERNPFETLDQRAASASWCGSPSSGAAGVKPDLKLGICGEHGGDPTLGRVLPRARARLRQLLAVPRAARPAGRRAGRARARAASTPSRSAAEQADPPLAPSASRASPRSPRAAARSGRAPDRRASRRRAFPRGRASRSRPHPRRRSPGGVARHRARWR